tara:strand:+ start:288 stop:668 length:381 start_codon:yes stop_codon:yes gene_type:complete
MSRYQFTIRNSNRESLARKLMSLPNGWRVEFKETKRTIPQNDRMWVFLTAVSTQLTWHGQRYTPEEWKDYFMHTLSGGRFMPAEDGGMVPIGRSTSKLGKQEHSLLTEIIEGFCERNGVILEEQAA